MIQLRLSSCTYHHSVKVKTCGRKKIVASDKIQDVDVILQVYTLNLEAKLLI